MKAQQLEIARDGMILGEFAETETVELLNTGFLRLTDQWRAPGSTNWQPLSELLAYADESASSGTWLEKAREKAADFRGLLATGAGRLGQGVKTLFASAEAGLDQTREKFLRDYQAEIRKRVQSVLEGSTAQRFHSAVRDEACMRKVFGAAYDCLPKPVCRFITEAAFVEFCLRHQKRLIEPPRPPDQPQTPNH